MNRSFLLGCLIALLAGCGGTVHQPSRTSGFRLDDPREIDDEDIAKAFFVSPQLPERLRVAYYTFDEKDVEQVEGMLQAVPGVVSTYRIPSLLASGARRFESSPSHYGERLTQPLSLKHLRLLAAYARADVLVVVDHGHEVRQIPNAWATAGVAIIPLLFVPWLDVEVESYIDGYVVDVRNGYLYGQLSTRDEGRDDYRLIYSEVADVLVEEQTATLMSEIGRLVAKLVRDERAKAPPPEAAAP